MTLSEIKDYCLSKKGAFEDYPFGDAPMVIKVDSKMFALISINDSIISISLKSDPTLSNILRQQYPSVKPGYHLNKTHWNTVEIDNSIPVKEILWMIDNSYDLVYKSLTKSQQNKLTK